jgi:hypothetical protein
MISCVTPTGKSSQRWVSHISLLHSGCSLIYTPVKTLRKKHRKAEEQEKESHIVWEELDSSIDDTTRQQWIELEELAMEFRGDYLKIYKVNLPASESCVRYFSSLSITCIYNADSHEVGKEKQSRVPSQVQRSHSSWLGVGLGLELKQYVGIYIVLLQLFTS